MWNIYAIQHNVTKRIYVGYTTRPIKFRFTAHIAALRRHKHPSKAMQTDFDEYGEDFTIINLESGDEETVRIGQKHYQLSSLKEKGWMKKLGTIENGYNNQDCVAKKIIKSKAINFEDFIK